jgi:sulfur-oxidizing protein SoxY
LSLLAKLPKNRARKAGDMTERTVGRIWALTRRGLVMSAAGWGVGRIARARADDDTQLYDVVKGLIGRDATWSDRIHLTMPRVFPNGYTVPLMLQIDSAMTSSDHVRQVRVLAPRNPIVAVATLHFVPERSQPQISTRIRLAEPQFVVAVATMNDDALLMAKAWVEVATNGCI